MLDSAREIQTAKQMNGNQKWPSYCETYEMNFHRRWKGDDGIYFGYRFWFHCLYEQNGLFFGSISHANGVFEIWFQWFLLFCMISCITVSCHCNTVKVVKAHTNEYRFLHTFGFHKNCSALRERERERETDNYVVMEKKSSGDARDRTWGLSHAKRMLYHRATSPSWNIGLLKNIIYIYLLSDTTSLLSKKAVK